MGSRETILERIRRNTQDIHEYPDLTALKESAVRYKDRVTAFRESLEAAGGKAVIAESPSDIDSIIRREYPDAERIVSPVSILECRTASPDDYAEPEELDGTDVAVVRGDFGVAENGAVWITDYGKHRALLFIAEALVILLCPSVLRIGGRVLFDMISTVLSPEIIERNTHTTRTCVNTH